jgi:hypothetical protein
MLTLATRGLSARIAARPGVAATRARASEPTPETRKNWRFIFGSYANEVWAARLKFAIFASGSTYWYPRSLSGSQSARIAIGRQ